MSRVGGLRAALFFPNPPLAYVRFRQANQDRRLSGRGLFCDLRDRQLSGRSARYRIAECRGAASESDTAPHDRLFLEAVIAALDALMILIARDQKDRMCVAIGEHSPSSDFAAIIYEIACDHG